MNHETLEVPGIAQRLENQQFLLVKRCPLQNVPQRSGRKVPLNDLGFYRDRDLVLTIYRVEVRDAMLTIEHADHGTEETGNPGISSLTA